jgi:hypothetical protein
MKRLISSSNQWPWSVKLYEITACGEPTYSVAVRCKGKTIFWIDGAEIKGDSDYSISIERKAAAFEEFKQQVEKMWEKFDV